MSVGGESSGAPSSARRALLPSSSSRPVLTRHLPEAPSRRGETVCSLLRKVPAPHLQNMLLAARSNFRASRSVFPTQWALGGSRWHHPGDVLKKRFLFWSRRSEMGGKKPRRGPGCAGVAESCHGLCPARGSQGDPHPCLTRRGGPCRHPGAPARQALCTPLSTFSLFLPPARWV